MKPAKKGTYEDTQESYEGVPIKYPAQTIDKTQNKTLVITIGKKEELQEDSYYAIQLRAYTVSVFSSQSA